MERTEPPPGAMTVFRGNVLGASAAFLEKKAKSEIEDQLQQLQAECIMKDEEIAHLKGLMSQGKLQKQLHLTLEENRDLRKEIERLYEEQINAQEISARLKAQEALTESIQKEFAEYREQTRIGLDQMRQDREEADKQLTIFQQRVQSEDQSEKETVILNNELQQKVVSYEAQLQAQAGLIAKLKDGTRLEELDNVVKALSDHVAQRELEHQDLERALLQAKSENTRLLQHTEDFEEKIKLTLSETVNNLTEQLHRYKNLVQTRDDELLSERGRYALLEDRILAADRKVLEMGERIRLYETGYCLDDALKEQRNQNHELSQLKNDIVSLTQKLNTRESQLERVAEENRVLRIKAGVDISWGITDTELQLEHHVKIEKLASLNEHYKSRIEKLEMERLELLEELRQKAIQKGENGVVFFGLSAEKMELVEKYVECLRTGEDFCPVNEATLRLENELEQALHSLSEIRTKYNLAVTTCDELRRALANSSSEANDKKIDQIMELISRIQTNNQRENIPKDGTTSNTSGFVGNQRVNASHLVACLEELAQTEELLATSRSKIMSYESSITSLSERVNSLFLIHSETSQNFKLEKEQLEQVIVKLSDQLAVLMQTLENRESEPMAGENQTAEAYRRRIAVLQSNEILLTRRLNILEKSLQTLESREAHSRDDRIQLERVLKSRIVQLEHSISNSTDRVHSLEAQLRDSVHRDLYDSLHSELAASQAKNAELVAEYAALQQQCLQINDMHDALEHHSREATDANFKVDSLTRQIEVLQSKLDEIPCEDDSKIKLLAQVAALEIREGNAQSALSRAQSQIAENASRYAKLSSDLSVLEDKYQTLLLSYHAEKENGAQSRKALAVQNAQHTSSVADLRAQLTKAKNDASRFKKLFQIARKHAVQLSNSKQDTQDQITGLTQTIAELQAYSDDHVALGQLHRELIDARLEIRNLKRNLEERAEQLQSLETEVLRQSKLLDENAAASFLEHTALRNRIDFLQRCLADISIANNLLLSGEQALVLHETNKLLAKKLKDARSEIVKADDRRQKAEESLGQIKLDQANDDELRNLIKMLQLGDFQDKFQLQIFEWTKHLKQLRLTKLQLEHQVALLSNQNALNEKLLLESQNELQRLQVIVSEKDSKLIAQTVHLKQQAALLSEISKRKLPQSALDPDGSELPPGQEENHAKELQRLHENTKSLQSVLDSKEQVIELQRQQISKLESRIEAEAEATAAALESPHLATEKLLKAAEVTIQSLRALLSQKDTALNKYREIMERAFKKYHSEKELDSQLIDQLKEQIAEEKAEQSTYLHNALNKIEEAKQVPVNLISRKHHEAAVAQKQRTIDELVSELKAIQQILEHSKKRSTELENEQLLLTDRIRNYETELESRRANEKKFEQMRRDLSDKNQKLSHLEEVIVRMKSQLVERGQETQLPPQSAVTPSRDAELKKSISSLKGAIRKLESQKVEAENKLRTTEERYQSTLYDLQVARKALESSQVENASLHNQLNAARSKLKTCREKHNACSEKLKSYASTLEQVQEARTKVEHLQKIVSDKEHLIETLQGASKHRQRASCEAVKTSRACSPVFFPESEHCSPKEKLSPETAHKDAFEQWELKKKLEKKVELLKTKLKEKSSDIKQLETCISDLKMKLQRLETENRKLIEALRSSEQSGKQTKFLSISDDQMESMEELRSKLFHSQEEVLDLKRKLEVEAASRIAQLEFQLKNVSALVKDKPRSAPEKSKLKQELDELSQKNLAASCENLDLRFEKEHSSVVIQRLRKRIAQLEQLMARGLKSSPNETKSESELTVTIDSMAKIIDSLKQENETLRLNSHSHLKYSEAVRSLKKAKKDWSSEVKELKAELHAKAEEVGFLTRAESAAKLNCRALRKDLAKVKKELIAKESEAGMLAQSVLELETQISQLREAMENVQPNAQQEAVMDREVGSGRDERWNELQSKYADVLAENEALKTELSAFDVSFFEEIEDLKFQYAETSKRLAQYRAKFGEIAVH